MEALSAVGSVIAVATVALQSSRVVYETISGIKNGPKEVRELALEVQQLYYLLEQVTKTSKKMDDRDTTSISELQGVIDQCRQNLDDFQQQFDKFEVSSNERGLSKAWTRLKLVVKKEDFRRMRRTISHYVNVLGVHLDLIGREMDNHHKVELARSMLQTSADSQLLRQNNGMLVQIGNSLSAVGSGLAQQEAQRGMEITMIKNGHQAADCLGGRLNDLASMSKGQSETLLEKLEQLQAQIGELKSLHGQAPATHSSTGEFSDNSRREEENRNLANQCRIKELSESIKRLSSLANKPRRTVFSHEAQCIISDTEKILSFISESPQFTEINETRKLRHDQITDTEFVEASRKSQPELDIEKMRGLLTSSELISVNQPASSSVNFSSEDRRHRQTTNQHYVTELGLVSVQVKRRRLLKNAEAHDDILTDEVDRQVENIFEATVSLIPERDFSRTKISASFLQKWTENGHFSLKPTLSFRAIIPDNSPIFTLTREGDLKGMVNHIQQGHASLTDCDSKGRTLLNYALRGYQFEVSKFLINTGADVDAIEPELLDKENNEEYLLPHIARISGFRVDVDFDETRFGLIWGFRRLLLEAGADPTNHHSNPGYLYPSFVYNMVFYNQFESLKKMFDMSAEFINLEDTLDERGRTSLLLCSWGGGKGVNPQCIKFLLDRGADVTAKDIYGYTCLHNVLRRIWDHSRCTTVKEVLVILIQAGADVYATTYDGKSVSDIAYTINSARGIWDEALSACGYDSTWFRKDFCRRNHPVVEHVGKFLTDADLYSECNGQDFEDFKDDEQNPQSNQLNFEDFGPDERGSPDTERHFDAVMQDMNIPSFPHDSNPSLSSAWGGFASSHGIEETTDDVNIWNQADCEPGEENVERPVVNLPDRHLLWGEDLPDADLGWGWDSNPLPQVASSSVSAPLFQNNAVIFEVEEGGEGWNTM